MDPQTFRFLLITDTHYFAEKLGCRGEAYDEFMAYEQKCFAETEAINEAAFRWLNGTDLADAVPARQRRNRQQNSIQQHMHDSRLVDSNRRRAHSLRDGQSAGDEPEPCGLAHEKNRRAENQRYPGNRGECVGRIASFVLAQRKT